jgi:hypothetical protein
MRTFIVINYGIICWGNSSSSGKIFTSHKEKSSRVMANTQPTTLCRTLLKQLGLLTVPCKCLLSLRNSIINNQENFQTNPPIHNINKINNNQHHIPNTNLSCFQKSAGIKIFNSIPPSLTLLKNDEAKFKAALKKYYFYCVGELLCVKMI